MGLVRVVVTEDALFDLERIVQFLSEGGHAESGDALAAILDAIQVLERHPLIGRPVDGTLRELVISFGRTGYVALYRFRPALPRVEILAVRHQREAGYA